MPLFVPVIIVGVNAIGIAAGGYAATKGTLKIRRGRQIAEKAETRHQFALDRASELRACVQQHLDWYAAQRADASARVLERMVVYLRANNRLAEVAGIEPLSEIPMAPEVLAPIEPGIDGTRAAWSVSAASRVAVASPALLAQLATNVGKASTGTAIKSLSGAAGKKATLAWLGGGAKAAGGGGMALGGVMGPLTAVGTGVTILGLGANIAGDQYLTSASVKAAQLDIAVEELKLNEAHVKAVRSRADELSMTLERATVAAEESLGALERLRLDDPETEHHFARTLQLVTTVSEIIRSPLRADRDTGPDIGCDTRSNAKRELSAEERGGE